MTEIAAKPQEKSAPLRRVAISTVVGTTLEWYDFFLYATAAALIFSKHYFPSISGTAQTIAALSTITVGYLARPIGSILFGHFGDRVGRKKLLVISLVLMGAATFAVGLLPNYAAIGIWAPLALFVFRLLQGMAVGGEWGGALLMAVEFAPPSKRAFYGSLPQLGAPLGFILSTAVLLVPSLLLDSPSFDSWGWRVPFLFSAVLIVVGLYLRARVPESPEFEAANESKKIARFPILEMFRKSWRQLLLGSAIGIPGGLGYFMFTTFILSYGSSLGVSRNTLLIAVIIGNIAMMSVIPYAAKVSDRRGPRLPVLVSLLGILIWAFPTVRLLETKSPVLITVAVVVGLIPVGISLATLSPWFAEMYDVEIRYTGAGLTYMMTGLLGSGLAAIVVPSLLATTNGSGLVAAYLGAWTVLGIICLGVTMTVMKKAAS
ncbi:MFS transporter [Nocardia sp. R6R-6]|uniref:MFS transporter n=1 Tax=Nocardia sp. R6R-6 TaxID=3459303 RepID=UPI00403DD2E9